MAGATALAPSQYAVLGGILLTSATLIWPPSTTQEKRRLSGEKAIASLEPEDAPWVPLVRVLCRSPVSVFHKAKDPARVSQANNWPLGDTSGGRPVPSWFGMVYRRVLVLKSQTMSSCEHTDANHWPVGENVIQRTVLV
jgi:hypothetical protein